MIRGAIFDVDGTILDSMSIWQEIGSRYLSRLGIAPEPDLDRILFSLSINQGVDYVVRHYRLHKTNAQVIAELSEMVFDFYANEVPLKRGVREFLNQLNQAGIPMTAATSSDRSYLTRAFARLRIDCFFEKILTTREMNTGKDQPDIYLAAAAFFHAKKQEIYVFEDALHAARTAHDAGFPVVGVFDAASAADAAAMKQLCDLYIKDFTQLSLTDFC